MKVRTIVEFDQDEDAEAYVAKRAKAVIEAVKAFADRLTAYADKVGTIDEKRPYYEIGEEIRQAFDDEIVAIVSPEELY